MYIKNRKLSPLFWLRWLGANLFGTEWHRDEWGVARRCLPFFSGNRWRSGAHPKSCGALHAELAIARKRRAQAVLRADELVLENLNLKRRVVAFNTAMRELQRSPDERINRLYEVIERRAAAIEASFKKQDTDVLRAVQALDKLQYEEL